MLISAWTVDITTLAVEFIVNAANNALVVGGGVDAAIHKAAGPELAAYSKKRYDYGCPTGQVKVSPGFRLPATHVLHTVGPDMRIYHQELGDELLASCYWECIRSAVATDRKIGDLAGPTPRLTVAFPAISTGVYGFNKQAAAKIAVSTVYYSLEMFPHVSVIFACFSEDDTAIIQTELDLQEE